MRRFHAAAIVFAVPAAFLLLSCGEAPEVIQGTVVSFDTTANLLTIRDECPPHREMTVSIEGAEIGAEPERDDRVRAAFRPEGDQPKALRVMNLTRQKEIGVFSDIDSSKRCPASEE